MRGLRILGSLQCAPTLGLQMLDVCRHSRLHLRQQLRRRALGPIPKAPAQPRHRSPVPSSPSEIACVQVAANCAPVDDSEVTPGEAHTMHVCHGLIDRLHTTMASDRLFPACLFRSDSAGTVVQRFPCSHGRMSALGQHCGLIVMPLDCIHDISGPHCIWLPEEPYRPTCMFDLQGLATVCPRWIWLEPSLRPCSAQLFSTSRRFHATNARASAT
jgi:hypothetical protein